MLESNAIDLIKTANNEDGNVLMPQFVIMGRVEHVYLVLTMKESMSIRLEFI